jgi:NADH dehydrogenase [ubiquinone] 1 alpha subcomplex assembly factor 5
MSDTMNIFDRRLQRLHRDRAAAGLAQHDFLLREIAGRLAERLDVVKRSFPLALDLGCHDGALAMALAERKGIGTLIQCDSSFLMAGFAARNGRPTLLANEELLPFAPECFDLVLSNLSLHWVNDLPGCLLQIREILKPDGLFLAALLGGGTLQELRDVLMEAELAAHGGAGPRVSPFVDLRDAGSLLQRAGFALPVADSDTVSVTYADLPALLRDLRGMGETNALQARPNKPLTRAAFAQADELYRRRHGDREGRLKVTFQVIYLTGWSPHESQQKPLRPGSAKARIADALKATEMSAGEKARPK